MSINSLQEKGLLEIKNTERSTVSPDVTLAFAFDSGYAECFKVMLASMAENGVLCRNPIVVYTDDEQLQDDPVVAAAADRISILSGERKKRLYTLARDNVKRPERANWNRGTFLKWCIFEEQETSKLLFLDVDMLTLNSLDGLLSAFPDKPLVTCPQFQQSIRTENTDEQLLNMLKGEFDNKHKSRINSGVMLVNNELLSDSFFDEITKFASERVSIHEQGLLSEYFASNKNMLGMASSRYNYQDSYLRFASDSVYKDILLDISIIHYAGGVKPWLDTSKSVEDLASIKIWHHYKSLATKIL
ncbi:glycosyltransferase family 8 protein [Alteromonas gracilis]|uniref:glycosyltransferase family 8 protein n=1 Tax=Alteromonas gracilis TaxID=1479524 RepID=UPI0037367FBB